MFRRTILYVALLLISYSCMETEPSTSKQFDFPFQNPELSIDERVDDLVSRMTREEKLLQLFNNAPAIEHLDIPGYNWWNEALHGVARAGKATVFPQAIGLAATFNEDLMFEVSNIISDEARAKHNHFLENDVRSIYTGLTFWSPNINIFRDPRWGRGQETYGEDPFLTGRMAVNFIKGLQGDDPKYLKTIATAKHYAVHSGPESSRHSDNFYVDDRDLYETYLPAFKMAVEEANVQSVMCAYNRFREQPCCGSDLLLQRILRDEFGFNGYVVTDCGAVTDFYGENYHNLVDRPSKAWGWSLSAGADLNCEEGRAFIEDNLDEAFDSGMINEANVNRAVKRLFKARFQLGMFDDPSQVPFSQIPYSIVGDERHLEAAQKASEQSLVLLKNDGILPLKNGTKIALIGPNADNEDVLLGNYNGVPINPSTPLSALRERLGNENVLYAPGGPLVPRIYGHLKPVPELHFYHYEGNKLVPGLEAKYYLGDEFEGEPALLKIDKEINFEWDATPINGTLEETFCVKWKGVFIPEKSGSYIFNGTADFTLDGKVLLDQKLGYIEYDEIRLEKGKEYKLESKFITRPHWWANQLYPSAKLTWVETSTSRDYEKEALEAAENSDIIVFCGGISPRLEGEEMKLEIDGFAGGDRTHLKLPENQEILLKKLHATGKPIVYINFSGSAIALNWENENIPAIVQAFYPGEPTGKALSGLLYGDFSPSGRLPVTFYKSVNDLPDFKEYKMKGRTYRYFDGEVLYPFGYGLSYTYFEYSDLIVPEQIQAGEFLNVSVNIKNAGDYNGIEVIQLYLTDEKASVPVPLRALTGFKNVFLKKGETKTISFQISPYQLAIIDDNNDRIVEPGTFIISLGGNSPDGKNNKNILQAEFNMVGEPFLIVGK